MGVYMKTHQCGRYYRDRPIYVVALNVVRDSERDVGGWLGQKMAILA